MNESPDPTVPRVRPVTLRDLVGRLDLPDILVLVGGGLIVAAAFQLHVTAGLAILGLGLAFLGVRLTR